MWLMGLWTARASGCGRGWRRPALWPATGRAEGRRDLAFDRPNLRRAPRPANDHDGSITTEAPNVMWGADGAVIPTARAGNVTVFIVAKHGNRDAAAEALAVAVSSVFGSVRADAARGVSLRHDHGSAFMSDSFQNQLKVFGMAPSFAFVRQPETNGVAERVTTHEAA